MRNNDLIVQTGDDTGLAFKNFADKMESDGAPPIAINSFKTLFSDFLSGKQPYLRESDIAPVSRDEVADMRGLSRYRDAGRAALSHTAIVKLNGGLGTSMGLEGPKSFLPVKEGRTFLDLILSQVHQLRSESGAQVPLVLMNSFWTDEQTRSRLAEERNAEGIIPLSFQQHRFPRIHRKSCSPLAWPELPALEWNPPGHGDIYISLLTSGILQRLLKAGYRYAFVSNSDNLGAIFNPDLLGYMAREEVPFLMEVCRRTALDRKGGHLIRTGGRLGLREVAQCAPEELDAFQNIDRYSFFNTNSIWLDLKAVEKAFVKLKQFPLQLIVNPKRAVPGDPSSPEVIQLETAMGSAISLFDGAKAVLVPRSRFSPVKTIGDLMLAMSDCFRVTDENAVECSVDWRKLPKVSLDPGVYSTVDRFFSRFPEGVPLLGQCRELTVHGDVKFLGGVRMDGTVTVINNSGNQGIVPSGRNLSGRVELA